MFEHRVSSLLPKTPLNQPLARTKPVTARFLQELLGDHHAVPDLWYRPCALVLDSCAVAPEKGRQDVCRRSQPSRSRLTTSQLASVHLSELLLLPVLPPNSVPITIDW